METAQLTAFLGTNSLGPILLRALLWFAVSIVIIASTDTSDHRRVNRNIKYNLGMLMLFMILCGSLMWMLFGFVPLV